MPTWEYYTYPDKYLSVDELNKLGAQGWELCGLALAYDNGNYEHRVAVFKRPKS